MKYLLTPITMLVWYLTASYGIYFAIVLMTFMFSLSWLWLIIGFTFMIGIIFALTNSIPGLLRLLILKLYGLNWFTVISHSVAGLVGVISIFYFFNSNPPELVSGNESVFMLKGMWNEAPFKTIFLALPFTGLILSLIWSTIIAPISMKIEGKEI
jgi:hypothetical protein